MRTSTVLAVFCLAVRIAPSFSLPIPSNQNLEGPLLSSSVPGEDSPHIAVRVENPKEAQLLKSAKGTKQSDGNPPGIVGHLVRSHREGVHLKKLADALHTGDRDTACPNGCKGKG
ncbi:hypothetical protein F5148DRAFT_1157646 [Russula earlei]|uniref:Uncharacterized protein n=1 Tax=Russula earlei TaxID=71964 RepID=A0ACC0UQ13_9AGAM|nr:hypothetical protein F5148DRAFT_1157646 [Russula earlei]